MSREFVHLAFQLLHALAEVVARFGQRLCVEYYTVALHFSQHGHQRHFDVVEHAGEFILLHLLFERLLEAERHVGMFFWLRPFGPMSSSM